jgi:membrane protein
MSSAWGEKALGCIVLALPAAILGPVPHTLLGRARSAVALVRAWIDGIPLVGRVVEEWRRVEVVDRAMVIAAQGLLALVPLVVVLVVYLPSDLTRAALERFADITGLAQASVERAVAGAPQPLTAADDARDRIGLVGALVTVLSASSFARAVMRAYEKVWEVPHLTGFRGRRRALGWLLVWLVALEGLSLVTRGLDRASVPLAVAIGVQVALTALLWWWSLRVLLHGARRWRALVVPALASAVAVVAFTRASSLVMPEYSLVSVRQFGGLGLVLALAAWLVGFSAVLVVSAILGRTGGELLDERVRRSPAPDEPGSQPEPAVRPSS